MMKRRSILGAVLFRESQERRFRITGSVLGAYLTVTLLHALWDGLPQAFAVQTPLGHLFSGPTTLSLISLAILWRVWREALDQQPRPAVTAAAPAPEGYER